MLYPFSLLLIKKRQLCLYENSRYPSCYLNASYLSQNSLFMSESADPTWNSIGKVLGSANLGQIMDWICLRRSDLDQNQSILETWSIK